MRAFYFVLLFLLSSLAIAGGNSPIIYNATCAAGALNLADGHCLSSAESNTYSPPLSLLSGTVSISQATSSVDGYLTHLDWATFNGKQDSIPGFSVAPIAASYTGDSNGDLATPITLTAVTPGAAGNAINITGDFSSSINDLIAAWNLANPSNQMVLTAGDGTQVMFAADTIQLGGGFDHGYTFAGPITPADDGVSHLGDSTHRYEHIWVNTLETTGADATVASDTGNVTLAAPNGSVVVNGLGFDPSGNMSMNGRSIDNAVLTHVRSSYFQLSGATPTGTVQPAAGTGATCSVTGVNQAGHIALHATNVSSSTGAYCNIVFTGGAFPSAPFCVFTPGNSDATHDGGQLHRIYLTTASDHFSVNFGVAENTTTDYEWFYMCEAAN